MWRGRVVSFEARPMGATSCANHYRAIYIYSTEDLLEQSVSLLK